MSNLPSVVEKSFCTTSEAATQLGVSVGTIQLWVESGLLQAWKTAGGHRRVLRDSVESLLHRKPAQTPAAMQASASDAPNQRSLRVLVVEDDASLLRLYETQIARWPMPTDVKLINNAIAALMHMGRGGPDLLIADLHMPGLDGLGMLNVLQSAPEMVHTTVVVVTGLDEAEIKARGGVPQGVEVLTKPIPFARLHAIAQHAWQQQHAVNPVH